MLAKMSSRSSMPALRAQKSRRLWLFQVKTWAKAEACWDQDETSVLMKRVLGKGSPGGGLMSSIATAQDLERRCFVSARPMPELAPVIRATGGDIVRVEGQDRETR